MASEDPHSPTTAGPEPAAVAAGPEVPSPDPSPQPTPTVGAGQGQPAGSALLGGAVSEDPHPEKLVGAAFAGGLAAALLLKGLARRKHR